MSDNLWFFSSLNWNIIQLWGVTNYCYWQTLKMTITFDVDWPICLPLRIRPTNFSHQTSSYTRILHHHGSKLRTPCRGTGRYPYASCQSWRMRNWHTPWGRLGCTWHSHQRQRSTNIHKLNLLYRLWAICPQTRQGRATMRRSRVPVMLFPYPILFFNLSNKQAVWLWLRLGVCKPCCHLSWQSSSRVRATAPAFLSHYALEWVV